MRTRRFKFSAVLMATMLVLLPVSWALATIDGVVSIGFVGNDRRTVGINTNANLSANAQPSIAYSNGTGANQVQVLYQAVRTFSGTTDTLNLTSGLTDAYGTAVVLTAGKALLIQNNSATNTIVIGAGTTPITSLLNSTGTITLNPGAFFCVADPTAAGWTITASTACNFNLTGTSGQTYTVIVMGLGT